LFVTEKGGKLRVIHTNGELLDQPFVDISDQVSSRGERGLLGLAFDPGFDIDNPGDDYVYVYYTRKATNENPVHNRVVRFKANGDIAEAGTEELVFRLNNLRTRGREADNHNGGAIHFGTDNKLYVAVGDNKRDRAAQRMNTLLGKMLRIEPEPNAEPNTNIPDDNPFYNVAEGENRAIWAKGLRNPYTFAVQPVTGKIHINDVGEQRWEEINVGEAGANYGWPRVEGPRKSRFTEPIFAYRHGSGRNRGCAITGGTFYKPQTVQFPAEEYEGDYFFADFCNGWIRRLDADGEGVSELVTGANLPVDLKVSQDGSLYYLSLGSGSVYKIQYTP
jgi:glucose/arabinose dehydrogenase